MSLRKRTHSAGFYRQLNSLSSADEWEAGTFLRKRIRKDERTYDVKCLLDKRVGADGICSYWFCREQAHRKSYCPAALSCLSASLKVMEYLVHWEGYSLFASTWEPSSEISGDLIR